MKTRQIHFFTYIQNHDTTDSIVQL